MNTLKIKGPKPFGVIISSDATKYLQYVVSGANKVLIVADETVFRYYGNSIKKIVRAECENVYTFIYPAGDNGRTKHCLDKLLILMTELGITSADCLVAFGGRSSASIVGLATKIFNGGIPYVFVPTTLMGMIDPVLDGKVGVDFLGRKQLLSATNYPVACFIDTTYLKTLPTECIRDGYAEIIRRAMIGDGNLIKEMQVRKPSFESMIYSSIKTAERLKSRKGFKKKWYFALNFSEVAEKNCALGTSCDKLIGFGIVTAIDTAMALGVSYGLEEPILELLAKYDIKWDVGLSINKTWQKIGEYNGKKITLVLPKTYGRARVVKVTKEKIKESF